MYSCIFKAPQKKLVITKTGYVLAENCFRPKIAFRPIMFPKFLAFMQVVGGRLVLSLCLQIEKLSLSVGDG